MKSVVAAITILFLLLSVSCRHLRHASKSNNDAADSVVVVDGGDGSSFENAVVIHTTKQTDGVAAEYDWLKENYPGYAFIKTYLTYNNNAPYDVFEIKTSDGAKKIVYFDITEFFGKN